MKIVGIVLAIVGIVGTAISGTADYIGLNLTQDNPDVTAFGWLQMLFVVIGVVIVIAGIAMFFIGSRKRVEEEVVEEEDEEVQQILDSFRGESGGTTPSEGTTVSEETYQEDRAYEGPAAASMAQEGTEPATVEEKTGEEEQTPTGDEDGAVSEQQPTETDATVQEDVIEEELFDV